jgi:hypothetical protein
MIEVKISTFRSKKKKKLVYSVALLFQKRNPEGKTIRITSYRGRFKTRAEAEKRKSELENDLRGQNE